MPELRHYVGTRSRYTDAVQENNLSGAFAGP